jgi:hypothetical protein
LISLVAGPEEAKNRAGKESLRLIQTRLATPSLQKISARLSIAKAEPRIADSSSPSAFQRRTRFLRRPNSNRASCASASVTAQDDSYTRVPHYQVLSYLSFPPADKKRQMPSQRKYLAKTVSISS